MWQLALPGGETEACEDPGTPQEPELGTSRVTHVTWQGRDGQPPSPQGGSRAQQALGSHAAQRDKGPIMSWAGGCRLRVLAQGGVHSPLWWWHLPGGPPGTVHLSQAPLRPPGWISGSGPRRDPRAQRCWTLFPGPPGTPSYSSRAMAPSWPPRAADPTSHASATRVPLPPLQPSRSCPFPQEAPTVP